MISKIYRAPEVDQLFRWSPSTRKRKIKDGEFPAPLSLGPNMVGWPEEWLEAYRRELINKREGETAFAT